MGGVIELLVRLVISMGAVMAVMGLAARLVRRRQGAGPLLPARRAAAAAPAGRPGRARPRKTRPVAPLEVLYRRSLSKTAAVSLVEATGRTFLLGVTDHAVTLLAELRDPAAQSVPALPSYGDAVSVQMTDTASVQLTDEGEWQQAGRMPGCEQAPAGAGTSDTAWKLALDSLRERTVRR